MNPYSGPISIAFFGATGGCTNACLAHTLRAGIRAVTLARNPIKLMNQLQEQGLDHAVITTYLTIVQGDAMDVSAVKRTIVPEQNNGALVSSIISGIGSVAKFQASISKPMVSENGNICTEAMETLIRAVREVLEQQSQSGLGGQQKQPLLTMISTTGISDIKEDVPSYLRGFYHHVLATPHADKRRMENLAKAAMKPAAASGPYGMPPTPPFSGIIAVRPALLKGDHSITTGKGWTNLRVGTEADPAVGCAIYRSDVGQWIFEEVIQRGGERWIDEAVTLAGPS